MNPPPESPSVRLVLIAAVSRNGVLASRGKIPWHLPRDTAHFRLRTAGHWLLLGRTTYEQMSGWFKSDQVPVVLSKRDGFEVPDGHVVESPAAGINLAQKHGINELLVCGGGQVYASTLAQANELILNTVEADFSGDVLFPEVQYADWQLLTEEFFPPDAENDFGMRISRWKRISADQHVTNPLV